MYLVLSVCEVPVRDKVDVLMDFLRVGESTRSRLRNALMIERKHKFELVESGFYANEQPHEVVESLAEKYIIEPRWRDLAEESIKSNRLFASLRTIPDGTPAAFFVLNPLEPLNWESWGLPSKLHAAYSCPLDLKSLCRMAEERRVDWVDRWRMKRISAIIAERAIS